MKARKNIFFAAALGLCALAATASLGPAQAQQSQASTWCYASDADGVSLDLKISGCTTVIQSGEISNSDALAYTNRGNAYRAKGQLDHAIEDYDQAIKLDPNFARAYRNRGLARTKKGDKKGADADFAEARRTSISAQVQQPLPSIVRDAIEDMGACNESVVLRKGFVVVKDVNGDGIKDYILDYGKFQCGDRLSGGWCGTGGCMTQIFASQANGRFAKVLDEIAQRVRFARVKGRSAMLLYVHSTGCDGAKKTAMDAS